jgi:hypothetical protein
MLTHEELSAIIHALVTGMPSRAVRLAYEASNLTDAQREALMRQLSEDRAPAVAVDLLGDTLRGWDASRDLVHECYRAAFYASDAAVELSGNPLFAHFLAKKGGLVLDKWPHYFEIYARYLSRFRGTRCRVLEIGVYRGGGLDLLRHYLGPDAVLVGVDIDPVAIAVASERHVVELGDQTDGEFLADVVQRHGPFDVVIDDGGHTMEQQIASADALLPLMPPGSVYLVEDTHTSYWEGYGGGRGIQGTFMEWVKARLDDVHAYHWSAEEPPSPWVDIDAIHVHDSVTVLDMGRSFAPFPEVVGTWDFLKLPRPLSAIHSELLATREAAVVERDKALLEREAARAAEEAAEEHARAATLAAQRATLSQQQAWSQLDALRSSRSWRITRPLRRNRARD